MIQLSSNDCQDLSKALTREWLETNGLGGFASSTIVGLNTRRYHGLLVASLNPPIERFLLLSKFEETIVINNQFYDLSCNQYSGAIHPQGFQFLKEFRLDPYPIFIYQVAGVEIKKSIFMRYGENTTIVQYQIRPSDSNAKIELQIRPLIAFRDYHCTTHENNEINRQIHVENSIVSMAPYEGMPTLYLANDASRVDTNSCWYKSFEFEAEMQRGLDFNEDLYNPCTLIFDLNERYSANIIASTKSQNISLVCDIQKAELKRRREIISLAPSEDPFIRQLTYASDQFLVKRKDQKTIIAGYPWFADWGRDTMIALPGITLVTGRIDIAKSILFNFAKHVDCGMIPNRFSESGDQPEYNTVDASLWFFEAVRSLLKYSGDYKFIKENFYSLFINMIHWHIRGTRYGICVDSDGLLTSGQKGVQLTWMDAKVGEWVVTPRIGKPVEVQALWYNALCFMEELSDIFGDKENNDQFRRMSIKAKESFNRQFWNEEKKCLYDCVDGVTKDSSIRPNQIFAVSLPYSMLDLNKQILVIQTVERELLTDFGLKSLSASDSQYKGRYQGDPWARDSAYHQGTVWSWLLGPYLTAYLKVNENSPESRQKAFAILKKIENHFFEVGLGQISEIFDADLPHTPRGCIAQAFSVGEILRASVEDVYKISSTALIGKTFS